MLKQKLLEDVDKIFTNNNIHYFLLYGIALGLHREKRILPWDGDIDIGTFFDSYDAVLSCKEDFEKVGYSFIQRVQHGRIFICDKKDALYYTNRKNSDGVVPYHAGISFFLKDKDKAVFLQLFNNDLFQRWFGHKNWLYILFTLLRVKHEVYPLSWFENLNYVNGFPVPSCTGEYLEYVYGKNWVTPVKTWSKYQHLQFNSAVRYHVIKEKRNRGIYYNILK